MEYKILLDRTDNLRDVIVEEQTRFVLSIIEALEIPFEWDANQAFTPFDKIKLRKILGQYNVSVIDDMDGGIKIYLERDKIAEFQKPTYILKEDLTQIDPKKKLYLEMNCKLSSIFEQENA